MKNRNNMMIKYIIWTDNKIGDKGAKMISESLKINTTLTILYLGSDENWRKNEIEFKK